MTKDQLRSLYTTVRSHVGAEYATKAAQSVIKRFLKDVPLTDGMIIAGYAPIQSEFNVTPLLEALLDLQHPCALPVITDGSQPLQFRSWTSEMPLERNSFQINEPGSDAVCVVPDVILVPLLACDKTGMRLGYGKGFYDRTIAAYRHTGKKILTVGVCYHAQLSDTALPFDEHDQKLDMIVTEKQVLTPLI